MSDDPKNSIAPSGERFFLAMVAGLGLLAGFCFWYAFRPATALASKNEFAPDRDRALVSFVLTNQTGRAVSQAELDGKYLVVDFLLTSCSLTCREVNRHMGEIQQLTTNQPDVRLVSLTVDPREDTVPVLADYGTNFGTNPDRWLLLTGDKTILYHLISTSFLNQDLNDPFSYMPGNFSHTDRMALVDARGRVRMYFDGLSDDVATNVVNAIARLRKKPL